MHSGLEKLKSNNPDIELKQVKNKAYVVEKPWGDDTFVLVFEKGKRLADFSDIYLFPEFSSLLHGNDNKWEFIFSPVKRDESLIKRNFQFNYKGENFKCYFSEITRQLQEISQAFVILSRESQTTYRNLRPFKDFFAERKPDYVIEYFKDRIPISFFVEGPIAKVLDEKIEFAKNLNFYLAYYDRYSPLIQIFPQEKEEAKFELPCYSLFDDFPEQINASSIDCTLLDIINAGHKRPGVRLEFIFYYQVLEYAAYYHLNNEDYRKLAGVLKRPDINSNSVNYTKEIIEILQEHFNIHKKNDLNKLHKVIEHYCTISDIKLELFRNKEFFQQPVKFDGGLELSELFKDETAIDTADKGVMRQVVNNINKIRNVIVHLRESRESTVILPTNRNDKLLRPYLFLIRRIAEKVAIQFE